MASSLIFLGIGIVLFLVVFGVMVIMSAAILGTIFTVLDGIIAQNPLSPEWQRIYDEVSETSGLLILMIMSIGIVLIVVKVIMVAAARGRD